MATPDDIKGLPSYDWRVAQDGDALVVQRREVEQIMGDHDILDLPELSKRIAAFAASHVDVQAEVDHDFESHPSYSCEYNLQVKGWRTVSNEELAREKNSRKAQERTALLEAKRRLEAEMQRVQTLEERL